MRGLSKKMLISILTSVIVFVTMVATTFAWVGIFTYANTDKFSINLKVQELDSNYYLVISSTGKKNSFADEIPSIELERQIVNSKYGSIYAGSSDEVIEKVFNDISLEPATTLIEENLFKQFKSVNVKKGDKFELIDSNGYYKFDLYLSVDTKEGISSETTGIRSNVILENIEEALTGTICEGMFSNGNPYGDLPSSPINDILKTMPINYKVNSKNAVRIGFSIFNPISIDDEYNDSDTPIFSRIYHGGNREPSYNQSTNVYDLGGCLPEDYNTALRELAVVRPQYFKYYHGNVIEELNKAIAREETDYSLTKDNRDLWRKNDYTSYLGCMNGVRTKMKISVYVWFEGWDSDCLKLIEKKPVTLNLTFSAGVDD